MSLNQMDMTACSISKYSELPTLNLCYFIYHSNYGNSVICPVVLWCFFNFSFTCLCTAWIQKEQTGCVHRSIGNVGSEVWNVNIGMTNYYRPPHLSLLLRLSGQRRWCDIINAFLSISVHPYDNHVYPYGHTVLTLYKH